MRAICEETAVPTLGFSFHFRFRGNQVSFLKQLKSHESGVTFLIVVMDAMNCILKAIQYVEIT